MNTGEAATREKILQAAQREFLEKGYQGAWLRDMAKKAGVTTGALYGYFKNKEELFGTLVREPYETLQAMYRQILADFASQSVETQQADMEAITISGMQQLADYLYNHYDACKLLLCRAKDTPYDDLVERMAMLDQEATTVFAQTGIPARRISPRLEHILTTGLFTMFFELIVHDVPREEAPAYLADLVHFYYGGYSRLMGF